MGMEIRCDRCGCVITHTCCESTREKLARLFEFKLECVPPGFNRNKREGYEEGDEKAPFFSEAFLYNLLGKEDARTVLAVLKNFVRSMGIDPDMTNWPKQTCRHQFAQHSRVKNERGASVEWCEECGAIREVVEGDPKYPDLKVLKPWVLPHRAEKVKKVKKVKK